jgi:predicted HTH domain antitoxin
LEPIEVSSPASAVDGAAVPTKLTSTMTRSLHLEYPGSLPDALQTSPAGFEKEAKMAMAVKLFELKRLSSGQAAQLVGLDRTSFLLRLSDYGANMIDLPLEDLSSDISHAGPA